MGLRAVLALFGSMALGCVHIVLGFTEVAAIYPLAFQGLAYAVYASSSWPCVPSLVEDHHVGIAYGTVTAVQNSGGVVIPMIVAYVYHLHHQYVPYVEYVFMAQAALGTIFGFLLNYYDYRI